METISKKVSEEFSKGNFEFAFEHFADDISWNVVGASVTQGKEAVINNCTRMMTDMAHSTLNNTNYIVSENSIAIEGYCDFINENNTAGKVEYCDVYHFKDEKLQQITSYCIEIKN
ncbi:MAG: nuclear transport factor 2 family protein [Chitinophagaceae bacterium]